MGLQEEASHNLPFIYHHLTDRGERATEREREKGWNIPGQILFMVLDEAMMALSLFKGLKVCLLSVTSGTGLSEMPLSNRKHSKKGCTVE